MDDILAMTAPAPCTCEYIDHLRTALAAACKERDELKASSRQVTEALRRNGFETLGDFIASNSQVRERLKTYEDAEKNGLLLVLPCKIGGTLYRICSTKSTRSKASATYIREVVLNENNFWRTIIGGEFGETVFLTKKEAKAALKEVAADG